MLYVACYLCNRSVGRDPAAIRSSIINLTLHPSHSSTLCYSYPLALTAQITSHSCHGKTTYEINTAVLGIQSRMICIRRVFCLSSLTRGCVSPLTGGTWNLSISSIILAKRCKKETGFYDKRRLFVNYPVFVVLLIAILQYSA